MAYRRSGHGDPIVFLHGNPTSSDLWRAVVGSVDHLGRCLAPDLVGMGDSDQRAGGTPRSRYRLAEQARYLDALLEALQVKDRVILVGHDWGAALAMWWARRHPAAVRGIAYLETLVAPVRSDGPNAPDADLFGPLRAATGEDLVLRNNFLVETVLPAGIIRELTDEELDTYRRPYLEPGESRRPTLTWAREIPIDGYPPDVHQILTDNADWMATTPVPKLFVNGDPGALLTAELRDQCRTWPAQTEVTVPGTHFLPEDSPRQIGSALADWIGTLP